MNQTAALADHRLAATQGNPPPAFGGRGSGEPGATPRPPSPHLPKRVQRKAERLERRLEFLDRQITEREARGEHVNHLVEAEAAALAWMLDYLDVSWPLVGEQAVAIMRTLDTEGHDG